MKLLLDLASVSVVFWILDFFPSLGFGGGDDDDEG